MTPGANALKEMKTLAGDNVIPEAEINKHVKELAGSNDRVAAIVGETIFEINVAGLLRRYFRPLSKEDQNALFSGVGPYHFLDKCRVAYAAGLLSEQQYQNIT